MEDIRERADRLLLGLKGLICSMDRLQKDAAREVEEIRALYTSRIDPIKQGIKLADKELRKLAKGNKAELFEGRDRIDLEYGALLHTTAKRVRRAKGMLERLKEQGLKDVIRIAESVNWDEIDKWPDEQLKKVGTERIEEERFEYEIF